MDKIDLLQKRDVDRKLQIEKRKIINEKSIANNEKLSVFEETFNNKREEIDLLLNQTKNIDKIQLPDHLNEISKNILLLQKYVAASNIFLRIYDIKKCQEILQDLTNTLQKCENEFLPKKKFGFKNKSLQSTKNSQCIRQQQQQQHSTDETDASSTTKSIIFNDIITCGFANKTNETLILKNDEIAFKDVSCDNLTNCTIKLFGYPSTLHLNNLNNCFIFTGPIITSIFVENCIDSTLIVACQQLRLHTSYKLKIYLHVTCHAVMEDCNEIFVAPYNWHYDGLDDDFKKSNLNRHVNNWDKIDDFNWLNLDCHSPNWNLIDGSSLTTNWD